MTFSRAGERFMPRKFGWGDTRIGIFSVSFDGPGEGFIDFRNGVGNVDMYIDGFLIDEDDSLGVLGWGVGDIFIRENAQDVDYIVNHMFFETSRGNVKATYADAGNGYYCILPGGDPWTGVPVPEPATYGAALGGLALGLGLWRRREILRRRRNLR